MDDLSAVTELSNILFKQGARTVPPYSISLSTLNHSINSPWNFSKYKHIGKIKNWINEVLPAAGIEHNLEVINLSGWAGNDLVCLKDVSKYTRSVNINQLPGLRDDLLRPFDDKDWFFSDSNTMDSLCLHKNRLLEKLTMILEAEEEGEEFPSGLQSNHRLMVFEMAYQKCTRLSFSVQPSSFHPIVAVELKQAIERVLSEAGILTSTHFEVRTSRDHGSVALWAPGRGGIKTLRAMYAIVNRINKEDVLCDGVLLKVLKIGGLLPNIRMVIRCMKEIEYVHNTSILSKTSLNSECEEPVIAELVLDSMQAEPVDVRDEKTLSDTVFMEGVVSILCSEGVLSNDKYYMDRCKDTTWSSEAQVIANDLCFTCAALASDKAVQLFDPVTGSDIVPIGTIVELEVKVDDTVCIVTLEKVGSWRKTLTIVAATLGRVAGKIAGKIAADKVLHTARVAAKSVVKQTSELQNIWKAITSMFAMGSLALMVKYGSGLGLYTLSVVGFRTWMSLSGKFSSNDGALRANNDDLLDIRRKEIKDKESKNRLEDENLKQFIQYSRENLPKLLKTEAEIYSHVIGGHYSLVVKRLTLPSNKEAVTLLRY